MDEDDDSMELDDDDNDNQNVYGQSSRLINGISTQRKTDDSLQKEKDIMPASEFKFGSEMIPGLQENSEKDNFFKF